MTAHEKARTLNSSPAARTAPDIRVDRWSLRELAGRLCELSSWGPGAGFSLAFGLVLDAQRAGEPVAWVAARGGSFFPPDAAAGGIDIGAVAVIHAPDGHAAARATDHLARSGGFGLICLDLGADSAIPMPLQTRLLGLAQRHDTAIVCITEKKSGRPSISSLVSLRAEAVRARAGENQFTCKANIIKDKRQGPGWSHVEVHRGPPGLR